MTDFDQPRTPFFWHSDAINEIALALSKAQGKLGAVAKDKTATVPTKAGGKYTFTYADLASVLEEVRAVLAEHELAVVQAVGPGGLLVTHLSHSSGQWMSTTSELKASPDKYGNVTPQAQGSAITYNRRYALCALLGIATADDDGKEARGAPGRSQRPEAPPLPETNHPALVKGFRDALNIAPAVLEAYLGHSVENITDEEAETLVEYGKAIRAGNEEAREELCGPSPAKQLEMEMADDA